MTEPPRATGAHRAEAGGRRLALLLASLVGVLLVAGAVWYALKHYGANDNASSSTPPPAAASTTHPRTSAPPPTSGSPSVSSASPPGSPSAVSPASASAEGSTSASAAKPPVDVLNNTHVSGFAASAAQKVRAAGWQVRTVTNYRVATLSTTTVFYPAGDKAAADSLAKTFGVSAVVPATPDVAQDALTLVLTSDWGAGTA